MLTRPFIDSVDFARRGGELRGEVPVAELPRMADTLADSAGNISYLLHGLAGKDGNPYLELMLEGQCNLRCQRCLNTLVYPVKQVSRLRLVSEGQHEGADIKDDEVDSIPAEKHLDVLTLIEEEILLNLPIAPKHVQGECQIAVDSMIWSGNPFALLAGLKK